VVVMVSIVFVIFRTGRVVVFDHSTAGFAVIAAAVLTEGNPSPKIAREFV
jgi:hypothetical protein